MGTVDLRLLETHGARSESAHVFVCEHCVADDGLCRRARIESLRTKLCQSSIEKEYWDKRYPKRNAFFPELFQRSKHFSEAALERSLTALYARREVARKADCAKRNRYGWEIATSWQIHDEIFYKYGFEVPLPQFLQNANRASWLRKPESELRETERISDVEWALLMGDRGRRAEYRKRKHDSLEVEASQPSKRQCMAGA